MKPLTYLCLLCIAALAGMYMNAENTPIAAFAFFAGCVKFGALAYLIQNSNTSKTK